MRPSSFLVVLTGMVVLAGAASAAVPLDPAGLRKFTTAFAGFDLNELNAGLRDPHPYVQDLCRCLVALHQQSAGRLPFGDMAIRYAINFVEFMEDSPTPALDDQLDNKVAWMLRTALFPHMKGAHALLKELVDVIKAKFQMSYSMTVTLVACRILFATPPSKHGLGGYFAIRGTEIRNVKRCVSTLNNLTPRPFPFSMPKVAAVSLLAHAFHIPTPTGCSWSSAASSDSNRDKGPPAALTDADVQKIVDAFLQKGGDVKSVVDALLEKKSDRAGVQQGPVPYEGEVAMCIQSLFKVTPVFGRFLMDGKRTANEYQEIEGQLPCEIPECEADRFKYPGQEGRIRYWNILPSPNSRVQLQTANDGNTYINADYVKLGEDRAQYIMTQAPLYNTIGDFYQMIWEQNTNIVVMLTELKEGNVDKAIDYWTEPKSFTNGMKVKLISDEELNGADNAPIGVYRTIEITFKSETRIVNQLQFTAWPDHGVPDLASFESLFSTYRLLREMMPSNSPVVVHCSAGVGRSGVFVAIDVAMDAHDAATGVKNSVSSPGDTREESAAPVTIFDTVMAIRTARRGAVQTEEQYDFIYRFVSNLLYGRSVY